MATTPPLPAGYTLDQPQGPPPLPPGYVLDQPQTDYAALAKQAGAISSRPAQTSGNVDYAALAKQAGATSSQPPVTFWNDPKTFLQQRSGELTQEAQRQMYQAVGPESQGKSTLARLGHSLLSLAPETGAMVDKLIAGGMDWKNAIVTAAGAVDPAIPAAYFGTQGAAQLSGNQPGVEAGNTSPENVQNALLAGSAVAGGGAAATHPSAGKLLNPKPVISLSLLLGKTPAEAYQSALKPSTALSAEERAAIVRTGLEQKIPVSKAGAERIGELVDSLNQQIKSQIDTGARQGVTVDPSAVAARTADVETRFRTQVNPTSDLKAIGAAKQEFLDINKTPIPAAEAQAMKQGTYRTLGSKAYGEVGSASQEAQKALARGLKEELATQFPELSKLNQSEGRLLELQPVLERAINRIGNHQLIGIGTPITTGAAKMVTGSSKLAAAAGILKMVLDNPAVKSHLAIALQKSGVPYTLAVARIQAYQASLASAGPGLASSSSEDSSSDQTPQQP